MSGIQALRWAELFPEEIEAIIGLDMSLPEAYENMNINSFFLELINSSAESGIIRLIPNVSNSDAIRYGKLTSEETDIYRALFYSKTMNKTMVQEAKDIRDSAMIVKENGIPDIPYLLFVSNGESKCMSQNILIN